MESRGLGCTFLGKGLSAHAVPRSVPVLVVRQRGHITNTVAQGRGWYLDKAMVVGMRDVHNRITQHIILRVLRFQHIDHEQFS